MRGSPIEEILFLVFHDILNLTLRFWSCLPTKYRLEILFLDKCMECFCQDIVSQVLTMGENLVLVIDDFPRFALPELKGKFMCVDGGFGPEWSLAEIDILVPGAGKDNGKEINFDAYAIFLPHPRFSKINLGFLSIWCQAASRRCAWMEEP